MAKTKKEKSKKEEVVINLDNAGIPIAILISGVLIAVVIYFASRNNSAVKLDTSGDPTVAESTDEGEEEFAEVVTTFGDTAVLGNRDTATVAIVEYNEFRCSYCKRHLDETFPLLEKNYIDTGKVIYVFKEFAIYGDDIANAAKCVYHLEGTDVYKEFHKSAFNLEDDDAIYKVAKDVGVNESKFKACYTAKQYQDEVEADREAGTSTGVQGTPGFVVGKVDGKGNVSGVLIAGAYPYETFVEAIESFLE